VEAWSEFRPVAPQLWVRRHKHDITEITVSEVLHQELERRRSRGGTRFELAWKSTVFGEEVVPTGVKDEEIVPIFGEYIDPIVVSKLSVIDPIESPQEHHR
jgi:hypothetical protein